MAPGAGATGLNPRPQAPWLHARPLASALLLALVTQVAAEEKAADACRNPLGQNELTACAWQEVEKAEAEMAAALAKAKQAMEAIGREWPESGFNPAGAVEALEQSQRGWLEYREGRCKIAGFGERGGSMEPMMAGHCQEAMTRARIAELDHLAAK